MADPFDLSLDQSCFDDWNVHPIPADQPVCEDSLPGILRILSILDATNVNPHLENKITISFYWTVFYLLSI